MTPARQNPSAPAVPVLSVPRMKALSETFPDAIAALRTAVAMTPRTVEAHNNLGIALGSSGDLDAAIAEFRRALAIDPTSPDARGNLELAQQAKAKSQGARR